MSVLNELKRSANLAWALALVFLSITGVIKWVGHTDWRYTAIATLFFLVLGLAWTVRDLSAPKDPLVVDRVGKNFRISTVAGNKEAGRRENKLTPTSTEYHHWLHHKDAKNDRQREEANTLYSFIKKGNGWMEKYGESTDPAWIADWDKNVAKWLEGHLGERYKDEFLKASPPFLFVGDAARSVAYNDYHYFLARVSWLENLLKKEY